MVDLYRVGTIVNTHGIKGEVRVKSITSYPDERYEKGAKLVWLSEDESRQHEFTVKSHRLHKQFHLLIFEGIENINDVQAFVGGSLNVSEDQLFDFELDEDTYYHHDIIGLTVVDEEGQEIGQVSEIIETAANDVWGVQRQGQKDLLLPFIDSVVLAIDFDQEIITVHVLEGLDD